MIDAANIIIININVKEFGVFFLPSWLSAIKDEQPKAISPKGLFPNKYNLEATCNLKKCATLDFNLKSTIYIL